MLRLPPKIPSLYSTRSFLRKICKRLMATSPDSVQDNKEQVIDAKPYSQVPGPKGLPIIGTLWTLLKNGGYYQRKTHLLHTEYREKYGPIFKDKIVNMEMLFISTPEDSAALFKAEGKYPSRGPLTPWIVYREQRKKSKGLLVG